MKIRITGMYVITDSVHPGQESLQGDEERAKGNEGRAPTEETKAEQPEQGGGNQGACGFREAGEERGRGQTEPRESRPSRRGSNVEVIRELQERRSGAVRWEGARLEGSEEGDEGLCTDTRTLGIPWWSGGYESSFQCRGHRFDPRVGS